MCYYLAIGDLLWVIVFLVVVIRYGLLCGEWWYFLMCFVARVVIFLGYFLASGGNFYVLWCGNW